MQALRLKLQLQDATPSSHRRGRSAKSDPDSQAGAGLSHFLILLVEKLPETPSSDLIFAQNYVAHYSDNHDRLNIYPAT